MGAATATNHQQQQQNFTCNGGKQSARLAAASKHELAGVVNPKSSSGSNKGDASNVAPVAAAAAAKSLGSNRADRNDCATATANAQLTVRPKRKATNRHIFRLMQTSNPAKAAEDDLMKALQASIELYPQYWSEQAAATAAASAAMSPSSSSLANSDDTASCSSSELLGGASASSGVSSTVSSPRNSIVGNKLLTATANNRRKTTPRHHLSLSISMMNRYKPVAKKNIYNEADFFHDGIMEFIEYELTLSYYEKSKRKLTAATPATNDKNFR